MLARWRSRCTAYASVQAVQVVCISVWAQAAGVSREDAFVGYREAPGISMTQPWQGYASRSSTAEYEQKKRSVSSEWHWRTDPVARLSISSLGVGTYLGATDEATDQAVADAIVVSVKHGLNVIDTAANYRNGQAESSVGRALRTIRQQNLAPREALFISTKAGFLNSELLAAAQRDDITKDEIVQNMHCMHPKCLRMSLDRSMRELGVKTIDLLYLHNAAEMQLAAVGGTEFRNRLKHAFQFMEEARIKGWIRYYGMATWDCFRLDPEQEGYLALRDVLKLAIEAGGIDHGFRYVQLPVNLAMPEAWNKNNQPLLHAHGSTHFLEVAKEARMGVFTSGPLLQAQLLQNAKLMKALEDAAFLESLSSSVNKVLQMARSTPDTLCTLVGMKDPEHVRENLLLSAVDVMEPSEFKLQYDDIVAAGVFDTS